MDIELFSKCLKDLLLGNDEVVVPGLGTFTAQTMPADVAEDGTPIPPYRKISYSLAEGEDDGFFLRWLAKYMPEGSNAATELQDFIEDLSGELDQTRSVDLTGIGTLKATGHKIYYFCCSNDLFQYPDVPGQESIEAMLPEDLAEEESKPIELSTEKWAKPGAEEKEEPIPDTDTFFSQLTEEEPTAEEQTEPMPEPTVQSEPQVIPSTPVAEETTPLPTEKETEDSAEQNSNSPVFVDPAQGGANPFKNAPPTEIDDHPVDEFIGEGDDRPGEGIHF